jgi:hypothetical protein
LSYLCLGGSHLGGDLFSLLGGGLRAKYRKMNLDQLQQDKITKQLSILYAVNI